MQIVTSWFPVYGLWNSSTTTPSTVTTMPIKIETLLVGTPLMVTTLLEPGFETIDVSRALNRERAEVVNGIRDRAASSYCHGR